MYELYFPSWILYRCDIKLFYYFFSFLHSSSNMAMRSLYWRKENIVWKFNLKCIRSFRWFYVPESFFSIFFRNKGFLGMYSNFCFHFKLCMLLSYYCLAKPLWKSGSAYHTILTYSSCIVSTVQKESSQRVFKWKHFFFLSNDTSK